MNDQIVQTFKGKKILIYGTGAIAENLIIKLRNCKIVGILDRIKIYGEKNNIPILMWEDIKTGDADTIIIAAPDKFFHEIYVRILPYCIARKINIVTPSGKDLIQYYGMNVVTSKLYLFAQSKEEIQSQIIENDVISFDIFDTLLMRTVYEPLDVFDMVENRISNKGIYIKNFKRVRREAELLASGKDIHVIYNILKNLIGLTDDDLNLIKKEEVKCEQEIIVVRKDMVELFNFAIENKRNVILTSDMYLPSEILNDILKAKGINGYSKLYVSCEYGKGKVSGLFQYIYEEFKGKRILHIGDDLDADVLSPKKYGINSCGVQKASDMLKMSILSNCIGFIKNLSDSILIGKINEQLFNSPFCSWNIHRNIKISELKQFIKIYFLPLVILYLQLLNRKLHQNKYDGIIFAARDGFIFNKCYEKLKLYNMIDGPDSYYILCSRKLAIRSGMSNSTDIFTVADFYNPYSVEDPVKQIFGIKETDISQVDLLSMKEYIRLYANKIISHSDITRKGYKKYLSDLGIDFKKKYLFCELDGHGTSHYYLNKLFENGLDSLYLVRQHIQKEYELPYVAVYDILGDDYSCLVKYTPILESIFTSSSKSVLDMDEEGNAEYAKEVRDDKQLNLIRKIYKIIVQECICYFMEYPIDICNISHDLVEKIFDTLSRLELCGECQEILNWSLYDEIINANINLLE